MLTGQYVFAQFETGDPARLGAQVIGELPEWEGLHFIEKLQ